MYALAVMVFLVATAFVQNIQGQGLICTAIAGNLAGVNDTWCGQNCFAPGTPTTPLFIASSCTVLGGASQVCQCTLPPVDCVGTLSAFGACSVSCGGGTQTAVFTVITPAQNGGKACQYADKAQVVQSCNVQSCPSTAFLCLAVPNTGANNDWCAVNCWPPGITDKTFANAAPACTTVGGQSQVCICNNIVSPSLQCLAIPATPATDAWCGLNCWAPGVDHTLANLVDACTSAGGANQICNCGIFGP